MAGGKSWVNEVPLGCSNKVCNCTGRCRRTPSEQKAYEEFEKAFDRVWRIMNDQEKDPCD